MTYLMIRTHLFFVQSKNLKTMRADLESIVSVRYESLLINAEQRTFISHVRFVQISTKLSHNIASCSDSELIELTTECLQSLGSENDADSSSSDSSGETNKEKEETSDAWRSSN